MTRAPKGFPRAVCRLSAAAAICVAFTACSSAPAREIALVARGMTFTVVGREDVANPTIVVRPGERIRVTLSNEAAGLIHDFAIPAWNVAIESLRTGERGETTFTVPQTAGPAEYRCRPHAELMKGVVDVAP
jgi:plastocyanin